MCCIWHPISFPGLGYRGVRLLDEAPALSVDE